MEGAEWRRARRRGNVTAILDRAEPERRRERFVKKRKQKMSEGASKRAGGPQVALGSVTPSTDKLEGVIPAALCPFDF